MNAIVTEEWHTLTTRAEFEEPFRIHGKKFGPGGSKVNDGTTWEVRHTITERPMRVTALHTERGDMYVPDGDGEFHVYAVKLTKKGKPFSATTHLLWWIHSPADLMRARDEYQGASR